ncbi:MAG TPA: serine hydrolase domain-containing protein [Chloroflexota bacterium]
MTFVAAVRSIVEETMATFRVPGVVIAAVREGRPVERLALGADATARPLAVDTLLPVASVTKLATALAVLRLADAGALSVDDPLARHLPEAAAAREGVTLRTLLSHTSGLPHDLPARAAPYEPGLRWPALALACTAIPPERPPNTRVQYSNVGYGLLAVVVERLTGQPFATALASLVLRPLGIEAYLGVEPPRPVAVVADVRGPEAGTPLEPFNTPFWRGLALPWAGLVTTADGALALLRAYRGAPTGFLRPEMAAEAVRNQTDDLAGGYAPPLLWTRCPWGLGPELRDAKRPHWAPDEASPDSFGHAGASGCVAWSDPTADVSWVVLGARTAENGWLVRRGPALGAAILTTLTA